MKGYSSAAKIVVKKSLYLTRRMAADAVSLCRAAMNSHFFYNDIKGLRVDGARDVVIIANGPSLKDTLERNMGFFRNKKVACINTFAASAYFEELKPELYFFLDANYLGREASERIRESNKKDMDALRQKVTWPMTIVMPLIVKNWNYFMGLPRVNKNISLAYVNTMVLSAHCSKWLRNFLYRMNLAMPLAQTVVVGALFTLINIGYKRIYLVGADHSWHESFFMDENNVLYLSDKHFFSEDVQPTPLIFGQKETQFAKMHEACMSLAYVFQGHQEVSEYAKYAGSKIYNASGKTYIDAYERIKL